jgi:hypothetical protein
VIIRTPRSKQLSCEQATNLLLGVLLLLGLGELIVLGGAIRLKLHTSTNTRSSGLGAA